MKHKFLHKCSVYWDNKDKIWVVKDKKCGEFAESKNWKRAVYLGIFHFKLELEEGISRVLSTHK